MPINSSIFPEGTFKDLPRPIGDEDIIQELVASERLSRVKAFTQAAFRAWIRDNNITPKFGIGQIVRARVEVLGETFAGEIRNVNMDGIYTVMIYALGHVRDGIGTHGLRFTWEDIEEIQPYR